MKASRLYNIAKAGLDPEANRAPSLDTIKGGFLAAISSTTVTSVAIVFRFCFRTGIRFQNDEFNFIYRRSKKPILKDFPKSASSSESVSADDESVSVSYHAQDEINLKKELLKLLGLNDEEALSSVDKIVEAHILEEIENLKLRYHFAMKNTTSFRQIEWALIYVR